MWILTLIIVIKRWLRTWTSKSLAQTYTESPKSIANPSLLGALPSTCIDWLKAGGPIKSSLLDPTGDEFMMIGLTTFQFVVCTSTLYKIVKTCIPFLNRNKSRSKESISPRRFLRFSIFATITALLVPALVTGIWIIVTVVAMKQNISLRYTNNVSQTGGCTFAMVGMVKTWGYWDVSYQLPERIVMSLLGAA
jgi:hypothetical protein